jgi:hypothetical protein
MRPGVTPGPDRGKDRPTAAGSDTDASLRGLMTLRGQQTYGIDALDTYTLATELLLRERDPASYSRLRSDRKWRPVAFAATFGRSHDAFVAEFEAYRRAP